MTNTPRPLMRLREVAVELGCHLNTARRVLRAHGVRPIFLGVTKPKNGRGQRYHPDDIDALKLRMREAWPPPRGTWRRRKEAA